MKYFYIIKFILTNNNGKFRYSYLFPLIGTFVGAYIIFTIYAIMNSMEYQIENRLNAFHYQYYIDNPDPDISCNSDDLIKGNVNAGYIKNNYNYEFVNVYAIDNYKNYINNKINPYLIKKDSLISSKDLLIGDNLGERLDVTIGDSLILFFPGNVNITTNYLPTVKYRIAGIFSIDLLNYDNNSVITSFDYFSSNNENYYCYFDDLNNLYPYFKKNYILSNLILDALKFEKLIYYFFGLLVIVVSCFMLLSAIIQSIKEKYNQIIILESLGLYEYKIKRILLSHNLLLVTALSLFAILLVNFTIFLHHRYDLFDFLYSSLPFNIDYVYLLTSESIILLIAINALSLVSSYIPFILNNER